MSEIDRKDVSVITLTTDFGVGSTYIAALKGAILSINPNATIVDITHDIPHQDVREGAVVLDDISRLFPPDTTHVAVVDPGVGTDRAIVYARIGEHHFVAPDNGLLSRLAAKNPPSVVIKLENERYWAKTVSSTFHGRDIMAPVAAHVSLGVDPVELGSEYGPIEVLDWPTAVRRHDRLEGVVLKVDSFGNLITNITAEMLAGHPTDDRACVICNIYETWGIYQAYGDHPNGTLVALIDSEERLELAVVGESAAERLGIQVGMPVVVAWE